MTVHIEPGYVHVIQPMRHATATKDWTVTYAYKYDNAFTPQATIDAADDSFRDAWRALIDTTVSIKPAVGYYRQLDGNLLLLTSTLVAQNGLAARTAPPPNVTACVRKRTAFVGKKFRGRVYMPSVLDEANVDETGLLTPSGVLALQGAADAWLSFMPSANCGPMYLLHSDATLDPTEVTTLLVQPICRTQRRRLPRG